jgi:hypothetical protein
MTSACVADYICHFSLGVGGIPEPYHHGIANHTFNEGIREDGLNATSFVIMTLSSPDLLFS